MVDISDDIRYRETVSEKWLRKIASIISLTGIILFYSNILYTLWNVGLDYILSVRSMSDIYFIVYQIDPFWLLISCGCFMYSLKLSMEHDMSIMSKLRKLRSR